MNEKEQLKADKLKLEYWSLMNPEQKEGKVLISYVKDLLEAQARIIRAEEREMACFAIANLKEALNVWKLIATREIRNPTNVYDYRPNNE